MLLLLITDEAMELISELWWGTNLGMTGGGMRLLEGLAKTMRFAGVDVHRINFGLKGLNEEDVVDSSTSTVSVVSLAVVSMATSIENSHCPDITYSTKSLQKHTCGPDCGVQV